MGKAGMEQKIIEEIDEFLETAQEQGSFPDFDYKTALNVTVANIISKFLSGIHYGKDDTSFLRFVDNVQASLREDNIKFLWSILPWSRYIPLPVFQRAQVSIIRRTEELIRFIHDMIEQKFGQKLEDCAVHTIDTNDISRDDVPPDFMQSYVNAVQSKEGGSFSSMFPPWPCSHQHIL